MGTFLVSAVLVFIVVLIIRGMIRDKRKGKSVLCGNDCRSCGGYCHQMKQNGGGRQHG